MAIGQSDLSLLFRLKAQNDASPAVKATQADIQKLASSTSASFGQMQKVSTQSLGAVTQSLTQVGGQLPIVGGAVSRLSSLFEGVAATSATSAAGIGAIAGPAILATGALVALTAGLGTALRGFVQLTQQTAEFQGKFFDLSQQVGVSVETLSTLDVIASTTGGNIDSVTASLGIFQKNLEAAHDPTSKEAKLLTELGVTSLNTEVALRQVTKGLFELTDKQRQTAAVLELFGRGGRFMNAILKESKGDISAATAEFERLGLITSTEAAIAADQFNDSLEILNRQLSAVTRNLVSQSIPAFIVFFEDINRAIQGNKAGWTSWADVIEFETTVALAAVESFAQFVATRGTLGFFDQFEANVRRITQQSRELRGTLLAEGVTERVAGLTTGGRVGDRPEADDGKKAAAAAQRRANKEIQLALRELEEITRHTRITLDRERDLDLQSIESWQKESSILLDQRLKGQQDIFEQEKENAKRFIKNAEDRSLALREIAQKEEVAQREHTRDSAKINDEAAKRRDQLELETEKRVSDLRDAFRQIELDEIQDFVNRGVITESEGAARILALLKDQHEQRQKLRDIEIAQETTSAKRKADLVDEKIAAERRYTAEFLRLIDERNRAREKEEFEEGKRPGSKPPPKPVPGPDQVPSPDIGPPPLPPGFDAWKDAWKELKAIGRDALDSLAFGVGSLVENWVLLGETGPKAMRKLVASVIAGVAAQAAVKAIYELAEGFAALFVNPAAAAAHFTSAAIFGSIAGVAAIAGRAVAGDAFQRTGRDSVGTGSGGGSGQLNPLTLNRNQPQAQTIRVEIVTKDSEFGRAITAHVLNDVTTAGPIREAFANDGVLP